MRMRASITTPVPRKCVKALARARAARLLVLGEEGEHIGEDLLALLLEGEGVEEPVVPLKLLRMFGRRYLAQKVLRARGVVDLVLGAEADPQGKGELRGPAESVLLYARGVGGRQMCGAC
eukprot:scaffold2561_cov108-Isochrysis_galbana.AAC.1